ncbi:UBP1-associated protein 2B-like [Carya illinoinensis]|uniref:RRM domain-containing protein n=1 Tax=Carya illinoinensis TaxID=32201 RepID=A0A8T1R3G1_CARIL|nr:UBP1-associated protein 2B-like [Carya illinoinensis]KAG6660903.1 hypothetical protein CIPAW_03G137100 [Carya illinoinensis]
MAKTPKTKKRRLVKKFKKDDLQQEVDTTSTSNKKPKTEKPRKPQPRPPPPQQQSLNTDSDSDSDSDSLPNLLELFSKGQLIDLISSTALQLPSLSRLVRQVADRDVSHRKIFVHGLGWDTTRQTLLSAFEPFGEIEDCTLVTDKVSGKAKGYAFVLFKTRKSAQEALKNPTKKIGNRLASWQLASVGPGAPLQSQDVAARRIYVNNVPADTDAELLRQFFAKFGEIEAGPFGFDQNTGRSRGFALFVYKSETGAKKVLEEPFRTFQGHRLHCQKATDGKGKNLVQGHVAAQPPLQAQRAPVLAAAQNSSLFGQHLNLNPLYSGFIPSPEAGFLAPAGVLNPSVTTTQLGGNQSFFGAHGVSGVGLQHLYPNMQVGQPSAGRNQGGGGSISGYPSYM